ncbi:hypothetical protein [Bacillus mobilis]|uniref:hypothetical protein n=1 Tax=Bacillus mobilis TaxID=2026190 RepID=UPI0036934590
MYRNYNVSVTMNEDEYQVLLELVKELSGRSYKDPSQAETLRHAVKFMRDKIDMPKLVEGLEKELKEEKKKNKLFEQAFIEFQEKIKM